jgi:hypothetical protein
VNVAVTFEETISLGTLLVMTLVAVAGAMGVIYGGRYRVAYEAASAAAQELRQALHDANDRLGEALRELAEARRVIERYEALPNLERIVTMMSDTAERSEARAEQRAQVAVEQVLKTLDRHDKALEQHENRAATRQNKTVEALNEITITLREIRGERRKP